jgi:hypothetical protein
MALEFQINLGGNFVEALNKSAAGLKETEKHTDGASKALEVFEGELGKVRAGALSINFNALQDGGHFFQFDLAEGAALAYEAIKRVGEAVIDLGKEMITAAGKAEDLNLAVKLDVGEEGAEKVEKLADSFRGSRFSAKGIKEALLPILEESGNTHAESWNDLVTAATDVATRRNTGVAGAKAALEALNDIELNPQRLRGSLKQLGIKQKDFYEDLGSLLSISAKTAEAQTKAGKVQAETLLSVAENQIAKREGGALGEATNEGSKTLGATLERLGNLKDNLFEKLAGSRGMQAVQGFLDNFITTMEGPIGTDLVAKIGGAFETLFGDLSGPDGLKKMDGVISKIANQMGDFIDDFKASWPDIKSGFVELGGIVGGIASSIGAVVDAVKWLKGVGEKIGNAAADEMERDTVGTVARRDLGGGGSIRLDERDEDELLDRAGKGGFFHKLFSSEDTLVNEAFEQLDKDKVPRMAAGGIVSSPTYALIGESGPEAVVPLDQMGGGNFSIGDVTVNVSTSSGDPAEIGRVVRVEVKKVLDEAAAAFGGA